MGEISVSTAVLRTSGSVFALTTTNTVTDMIAAAARRFVHPFDSDFALALRTPAANAPTASATARDRFETPAELLVDALFEAAVFASHAPSEQQVPSADTQREAIKLLRMLPSDVDMPGPVIEPSGAISWNWERGSDEVLILAVDGKGRVQRSAIFDGEESWDTTPLAESLQAEDLALLARFRVSHA